MRSLRLDSFRATRIGLVFAIIIMLALIVWFFMARVTLYEVSSTSGMERRRKAYGYILEGGARSLAAWHARTSAPASGAGSASDDHPGSGV